jgi:hypothetical protein
MPDFINHLQHRIETTKLRLKELSDQMGALTQEHQMATADLQGFERTLAAEMREQGMKVPQATAQETLPLNGGGETNKAEFARKFIRGRADSGATPMDLYQGFKDAGIPIGRAYIYALVQRLQKQDAIRSRRGKWYPVPEAEQHDGAGA